MGRELVTAHINEASLKLGIEMSLTEAGSGTRLRADSGPRLDGAESQVSDACIPTRLEELGPRVVLLTLSRRPQALREILLQAPELDGCRAALAEHGFAVELDSGAKAFVRPEHYEAVLSAVRLAGLSL